MAELVDQGNRLYVMAHSKRGTPAPKPIKINRPGDERKRKRKATADELAAFMGGRVRYSGPPQAPGVPLERLRCEQGHYVAQGRPCRVCEGPPSAFGDHLR